MKLAGCSVHGGKVLCPFSLGLQSLARRFVGGMAQSNCSLSTKIAVQPRFVVCKIAFKAWQQISTQHTYVWQRFCEITSPPFPAHFFVVSEVSNLRIKQRLGASSYDATASCEQEGPVRPLQHQRTLVSDLHL
jgi:hypothetical protein